jgi:hypothetical protein
MELQLLGPAGLPHHRAQARRCGHACGGGQPARPLLPAAHPPLPGFPAGSCPWCWTGWKRCPGARSALQVRAAQPLTSLARPCTQPGQGCSGRGGRQTAMLTSSHAAEPSRLPPAPPPPSRPGGAAHRNDVLLTLPSPPPFRRPRPLPAPPRNTMPWLLRGPAGSGLGGSLAAAVAVMAAARGLRHSALAPVWAFNAPPIIAEVPDFRLWCSKGLLGGAEPGEGVGAGGGGEGVVLMHGP